MTHPAAPRPGRSWDVRALDVAVSLEVEDVRLAGTLAELLADLSAPSAPARPPAALTVSVRGEGPWQVSSPSHRATASTAQQALAETLTAVNVSAVEATPTLAVHAAVAARGGSAVVVPGRSGHGKTTFVAALLSRGWDYVSDESLSVRWDDGAVVPYPRPLALSTWAAGLLGVEGVASAGEVLVRAAALGARPVAADPRVRDVVLLERVDGPPQLHPVHRTDALAALLERGFTHHQDPSRALTLVADLVRGARCWRLRLADPRTAADLLSDRLPRA